MNNLEVSAPKEKPAAAQHQPTESPNFDLHELISGIPALNDRPTSTPNSPTPGRITKLNSEYDDGGAYSDRAAHNVASNLELDYANAKRGDKDEQNFIRNYLQKLA